MTQVERPIVVVCSWCPNVEEQMRIAHAAGNRVTHGMCPACAKRVEDEELTPHTS